MLRWSWRHIVHRRCCTPARTFTTTSKLHHDTPQPGNRRTRNIGIIAHIDAGKTTTTERMLYYSGHTRRLGDVDDGSTVTDFLPAERARGITIQSAAISFAWPPSPPSSDPKTGSGHVELENGQRASTVPHNINLIDTPGHADFTFEVLRSLRVLDGAVTILDGVAGVEAQTEKVWHQASAYAIPRIIFVNKLDREGAAFARTVREVGSKLGVWPVVCGIPWWRAEDGRFVGVGDVVALRGLRWEEGTDGRGVSALSLEELRGVDAKMADELAKAREALVERLSEHDEEMVEKFLEADEDHLAIKETDIIASLRRCTMRSPQQVAPVFAGASFRNIGVQPLLDAVVDLLPSPAERPDAEITVGSTNSTLTALLSGNLTDTSLTERKRKSTALIANLQACALAFKVVSDPKRGVLVYIRVYSGSLLRGAQIYNTNLNIVERCPRLLRMYASDAMDIPSISAGQIGVIVGLKHARTGDTLLAYQGMNPKTGPPHPLDTLQLRPIAVPPPVFFTSIEPESLAEEKHIKETLGILLREDPSLSVSVDAENGQTHLAGMGELHLEIARDRLINEFKARARIGKIDINYREACEVASGEVDVLVERDVGGKFAHAGARASVSPMTAAIESAAISGDGKTEIELADGNHLTISHTTLTPSGHLTASSEDSKSPFPPHLSFSTALSTLKSGVTAALARGPTHGFPIHSTHITLTLNPETQIFPDTSSAALSMAAREAVAAALVSAKAQRGFALMEPVMRVTISVGEADLGAVVHDLSSARGGSIISLDSDDSTSTSSQNSIEIKPEAIYAPPDPYASELTKSDGGGGVMRQITARVPLREMVGYLRYLRALTGGRGTFVMGVDRFERVAGGRLAEVLREVRGA